MLQILQTPNTLNIHAYYYDKYKIKYDTETHIFKKKKSNVYFQKSFGRNIERHIKQQNTLGFKK